MQVWCGPAALRSQTAAPLIFTGQLMVVVLETALVLSGVEFTRRYSRFGRARSKCRFLFQYPSIGTQIRRQRVLRGSAPE